MVVDLLLIVTPIVGFCNCSRFCFVLLCVHSRFAKRASVFLVSRDCSFSWCHGFV